MKRRTNVPGTVYLLHFESKYKHAQHYIGWTEDSDITKRLETHRSGNGANLLKHVFKSGIKVCCVRVWRGENRNFERTLKKRKNSAKLCPLCK